MNQQKNELKSSIIPFSKGLEGRGFPSSFSGLKNKTTVKKSVNE